MKTKNEALAVQRWPNGRWTSTGSIGPDWLQLSVVPKQMPVTVAATVFQLSLFDAQGTDKAIGATPSPTACSTP